jgi:cell division protein FtsL
MAARRHSGLPKARWWIFPVVVLVGVQVGIVRQVQWVRRELVRLEETRAARRRSEAEVHRLERELVALCRPDIVADRAAEELGMQPAGVDEVGFAEVGREAGPEGLLPPCIMEAVHAATVGAE